MGVLLKNIDNNYFQVTRKEGDLASFSGANSATYQQKVKRKDSDERHPLFKRFRR